MILISEAEARGQISIDVAFRAVQQALIAAADGSGSANPVLIAKGLSEGETFSLKSGTASRARLVGLKVGTYWPGNAVRNLPCHASCVVLLDPDTGRLMAVVETNSVNGLRTAAADAVAANALALSKASTLTIIGAGHQAGYEARALCAIRPIRQVLIVGRDRSRAQSLCHELAADLRIHAEPASLERACHEADILVTVTPSRTPLFEATWVKPGVHVASMGSDQFGKQELPLNLVRSARLFCDLPAQSIAIGEFQHVKNEVQSGAIALTAIGDVLRGHAQGRRSAEEITVFDSSGLALQDLYVAATLLRTRPNDG